MSTPDCPGSGSIVARIVAPSVRLSSVANGVRWSIISQSSAAMITSIRCVGSKSNESRRQPIVFAANSPRSVGVILLRGSGIASTHSDPLRVVFHCALNTSVCVPALLLPFVLCMLTLDQDLRSREQAQTDTREKNV